MLTSGDELGRTQGGNNNAYCLDSPVSWLDWDLTAWQHDLLAWTRRLLTLRREHPVFRQRHFLEGRPAHPGGPKDLAWFRPDGSELVDHNWFSPDVGTLGMYLSGDALRSRSRRGERIRDDTFLLLVHAGGSATTFTLPSSPWATGWSVVLDTATDQPASDERPAAAGSALPMAARSAQLLRAT